MSVYHFIHRIVHVIISLPISIHLPKALWSWLPFDSVIPFISFSNHRCCVSCHTHTYPCGAHGQFKSLNKVPTIKCLTQKNVHDSQLANNWKINRSVILQSDISDTTGDDEVTVIRYGSILLSTVC